VPNMRLTQPHFLKMKKDYYLSLRSNRQTLILDVRKDEENVESLRYGYDSHNQEEYDSYTLYYDGRVALTDQEDEDKGSPLQKSIEISVSTLELEVKEISLTTRFQKYVTYLEERYSIRRVDPKPRMFSSSVQTVLFLEREEGVHV